MILRVSQSVNQRRGRACQDLTTASATAKMKQKLKNHREERPGQVADQAGVRHVCGANNLPNLAEIRLGRRGRPSVPSALVLSLR